MSRPKQFQELLKQFLTAKDVDRLDALGVYFCSVEWNESKKVNIASGQAWTYSYDQANHLTRVERRTTEGGTLALSADYKYDAWGNGWRSRWTPTGPVRARRRRRGSPTTVGGASD